MGSGLTFGCDKLTHQGFRAVEKYPDGVNDDVIQSAVGFKVNPWGGLVLTASFQFPVNRDGIRADVIYTGQAEYNF